jgi:hypothetical protein
MILLLYCRPAPPRPQVQTFFQPQNPPLYIEPSHASRVKNLPRIWSHLPRSPWHERQKRAKVEQASRAQTHITTLLIGPKSKKIEVLPARFIMPVPCYAHVFRWRVLTTTSVSKSISQKWRYPSRPGGPRTLPARRRRSPRFLPSSPRSSILDPSTQSQEGPNEEGNRDSSQGLHASSEDARFGKSILIPTTVILDSVNYRSTDTTPHLVPAQGLSSMSLMHDASYIIHWQYNSWRVLTI